MWNFSLALILMAMTSAILEWWCETLMIHATQVIYALLLLLLLLLIIIIIPIDSKCRMCYAAEEQIKHMVAKCTTLVPFEYTTKTQWTVCKHMVLQITDKYCT